MFQRLRVARVLLRILFATVTSTLAATPKLAAQTYTWDIVPGAVGPGNGTITGGTGTWDTSAGNWTTDAGANNVAWVNGSTSIALFGGTSGTVSLGSPITANGLLFNSAGYLIQGNTLTFDGTSSTISTARGVSATVSSILAGSAGLTKSGPGALTLNGATGNSLTGGLTLNAGSMTLDFANLAGSTNLMNSSNSLSFGGAVLNVNGNSTTPTSQTFASLAVNSGLSLITLVSNNSLANTLAVTSNSITRNPGGSLVFILPVNTSVAWNPTLTNDIIGPWAGTSIGGGNLSYATISGGNIAALTGTSAANPAAMTDTTGVANYDLLAGGALTAGTSVNTIRYLGTAVNTISTNTLTLNGLMSATVTGATTRLLTISSAVTIGSTQELMVASSGTNSLNTATERNITISGVISNNGAGTSGITYSGVTGNPVNLSSVLTLSAANSFSGPLTINGGAVAITNFNSPGLNQSIGTSNSIVINGGILRGNGNNNNWAPVITVGPNGAIIDSQAGFLFNHGTFVGSGTLTAITSNSIASAWMLYTAASPAFTGNIVIGDGVLNNCGIQIRSSAANPFGLTATITVNTGAALTADGDGTWGTPSTLGNTIILNGGTLGTQGPNMNYTGSVILQANSSIGSPFTGNSTAGSVTLSGVVSGTGSLAKVSADLAILTNANTYSGGTIFTAGTLAINNANALGTGPLTMNGGSYDNTTAGPITIVGDPLQTWNAGGFTYVGTQPISLGSGAVTLAATATTTINTGKTLALANAISGSGFGITKAGLGTLSLSGLSTFSGPTGVNAGTLQLDLTTNNTGVFNSASALTLGGGTLAVKGQSGLASSSQAFSALTLNASTANTITIDPNNGGGTTLNIGSVWTRGANSSLLIDYSSANAGGRVINTGGVVTGTGAAVNGIFGYALVKDSAGVTGIAAQDGSFNIIRYDDTTGSTLTTSSDSATTNFTTLNTVYTVGTLTWTNGGTLTTRAVNSLSLDSTINGGTIDMGSSSNVLTLSSGIVLYRGGNNIRVQGGQFGAAASAVNVQQLGTGTLTIASPISSGAGSLIKGGPGTLVLTAVNSYTGGTVIGSGTLSINDGTINSNSTTAPTGTNLVPASGNYTIASGATLMFNYLTANPTTAGQVSLFTPPWARMPNSAGNVVLRTNALASPSWSDWGTLALPATFTGRLIVETGRVQATGDAALGGAGTIIDIRNGAQLLLFAATYSRSIFIAGQNGAGEGGQPEALRSAGSAAVTFNGPITLTGDAGFWGQGASTVNFNGQITGNFQMEFNGASGTTTVTPNTGIRNSYGSTKVSTTASTVLIAGNANAFSPGPVLMNNGTMRLNNFSFDFAGLNSTGTTGTINNNGTTAIATMTIGSGNGTDNYSATLSNGSTQPLAFTKIGSGTQTLTGANIIYTGNTTINAGALALANTTGFASNVVFSATGTPKLQLSAPLISDNWTFGGTKTITGGSTGAIIEKIGLGTVTLAPAAGSTFTGSSTAALTVSGGKLYVNNANFTTAPAATVASGATLGGTGTVGSVSVNSGGLLEGGQLNAGTLTAGSLTFAGGSTLSGTLATGVTPFVVNGDVLTNGTGSVIVNVTGTLPANNTYHFLQYGSLSGSGFPGFAFAAQSRSLTLQHNTPFIDIVVNVGAFPIWTGANSGAFVGGNNWKLNTDGTPTDFLLADNCLLDDTATGTTAITVGSNVLPTSMTFNFGSTVTNYSLSGSGAIAGGTLEKSGTGTLTINNANTYSGGTTLNAGTLNINNASAIGIGPLTINGGVINNSSGGAIALSTNNLQTWASDFTFTGTQSLNMGTGAVTLTDNRIVTVTANTLSVGGIGGTGFALTKEGAGTLVLSGANTYNAPTTINAGRLELGNGAINGSFTTSTYSVAAGAALRVNNLTAVTTIPWANITGEGTIALNSAQPVNGTAYWGNLAISAGFTGTLLVEKGRVDSPGGAANLGGTTVIDIRNGAQYLAFTGTYTQTALIAGQGWGEGGLPSALRAAGSSNVTWNGPVTLQADAGILSQGGASFFITGSITGAFQADFIAQGGATLTINPSAAVQNAYSSTMISGPGAVVAGNSFAFSTGPLLINGGTLRLNGSDFTFDSLTGSTGNIQNGSGISATITVGTNNASTAYGGTLTNGTTAPLGLTKIGTGTLTLSGTNTYSGVTTISDGVLSVAVIGNGGGTTGNIGSATNDPSNIVFDGGTMRYTGVTATSDRGFTINTDKTAGFDITANSLTLSGSINPSNGSLTKTGTGTLVLSGTANYSGTTAVSNGSLFLNGAGSTTAISVAGGALLGGSGNLSAANVTVASNGGLAPGFNGSGQMVVSSLAFSGTASVTIGTLSNYNTDPALVVSTADALSTTGSQSVTLNLSSLGSVVIGNTYKLIGYSGTIGGSGFGGFTLGTPLPSRAVGTLVNNPGEVALTITAIDFIKWTGTGTLANGWDTTTQNWKLNSNNAATTFINAPGDSVVFDDSAPVANTSVVLNTLNVSPSNVKFENSTNNYTLQGSFGITGSTGVTKTGTGTLTIFNSNSFSGGLTVSGGSVTIFAAQSYTGGTTLNAGTLNLNNSGAIGTTALTINGGTINNSSAAAVTLTTNNPQFWVGNFAFTGTQDLNLGTGAVTLNTDITVAANGGTLTVGGVISGAFGIAKTGTGTLALTAAASNYNGTTTISGGVLSFNTAAGNGNNSSLGSGSDVAIDGGTLRYTGPNFGTNNGDQFGRNITIGTNGATLDVFGAAAGFLFHSGSFIGDGNISIVSTGGGLRQWLYTGDSPTFTGDISVGNGSPNSGWLQYRSSASTPFGTATITINTGGQLSSDNGSSNPNTLTNAIVFNGGMLLSQGALVNYTGQITVTPATTSLLSPTGTVDIILGGNITGSGTLDKNAGTFSMRLAGDNSGFTGTYIHSGLGATIFYSPDAGSAAAIWNLTNTGGGRFMSALPGDGTISLGALSGNAGSLLQNLLPVNTTYSIGALGTDTTFNGTVNDNGGTVSILKFGAGTLTLTGNNAYSGVTTVNAGTLRAGSATAFGQPAFATLSFGPNSTGTVQLFGNSVAVIGLNSDALPGTPIVESGSATAGTDVLTVNNVTTNTFAGTLRNGSTRTLSLVKDGTGDLVLNGTNTYTGGTVVAAGTLGGVGSLAGNVQVLGGRLRGDSDVGTGTLTIGSANVTSSGGIAATLGSSGVNSRLALGGGTLNLATSSTLQLTAVSGFTNLVQFASYPLATLSNGANLQLDGTGVIDGFVFGSYTEGLGATGAVTIDLSTFGFALAPGDQFSLSRSGNNLVLNFTSPVPEPTTLFAVAGLLVLAGFRRKAAR